MNKERLIAFTDAIAAIAATIMVLELASPSEMTISGLAEQWPVFLAYVISFFLIYIVWYSHHNAFHKATVISTRTFLINGIWTFWLTLVPFATRLIGEYPNEKLAMLIYLVLQLVWSVTFQFMDYQILKDNPGARRDVSNGFIPRLVLYGGFTVAIGLTFVTPIAGLITVAMTTIALAAVMFGAGKRSEEKKA